MIHTLPSVEFPRVLDSTFMSTARTCKRKLYLESFEHWKPKGHSVHLHAGAAFARGLEVARESYYVQGLPEHEAIPAGLHALAVAYGDFECPPDSPKSLERMMGAFEYYFSEYPLGTDTARPSALPGGKLGIEFSFASPIDAVHPADGDPLLYCGRFDMIADYAGGRYGEDDKTASQLGPTWSRQWDLRSQFTAYTWGARELGIHLEGFIVRGISILKTKYDTQQAITYRPTWHVDQWYEKILAEVADLQRCWEDREWHPAFDDACNAYGGCPFRRVCLSEPATATVWLRRDFERRQWDPITRTETLLADE